VKIAEAQRGSGEASAKAEGFRLEIARAGERAAEAERETARIRERFADRTLTDSQAEIVVRKLAAFPGQEFTVTTYTGLREPLALANRILGAIAAAGWKPIKSEAIALFPGISGIQVYRHPDADSSTREAADALVSVLQGHHRRFADPESSQ
jgi:hypothetical protein